jgi:hypothetical protein
MYTGFSILVLIITPDRISLNNKYLEYLIASTGGAKEAEEIK